MQTVWTVTFPDRDLLARVQPLPAGIEASVWDLRSGPEGIALDAIDAVILPYIDASAVLGSLSKTPNLKFVQTQSTGFDGVPEAAGPETAVASASGVHAAATAELAIGLMIAKLRGIDQAVRDQQTGNWQPQRRSSLADRKVLLVGVGGIGNEIAKRLEPFEVEITRVGSSARGDSTGRIHASYELAALAQSHDILVAVTPLNEHTHRLVDASVLAALPNGALVVNVGRGPVVDTAALTAEVLSGRLHCALDVVDPEPLPANHPLWSSPNALITPHIGGNASAFEPRIVKLLASQLKALASGDRPANLVQSGPF
ncbi:hydroxyacid dehydrogenase [Arthrobacter sp. Leaf141]|uniref:2-hydroxyacid dehydrogenase n=1 Tax=unclassified Arthrobacter TaxID=235627 RepID=UPI0006F20749|nr:2-hydroxyacid dehydrogenase [Arthrobacter sp. Leaf141]KQQ94870.1 hydroxyacid dehydrogenase [Arthrobacter sp. Leaf141]